MSDIFYILLRKIAAAETDQCLLIAGQRIPCTDRLLELNGSLRIVSAASGTARQFIKRHAQIVGGFQIQIDNLRLIGACLRKQNSFLLFLPVKNVNQLLIVSDRKSVV